MARRAAFFVLLAVCLLLAARVSEQYPWRADLSAQRINSLSDSAARALDALPGGLEITAFVPELPVQRAQVERLLAPYLAHAPGIHFAFVDPVREPEIARERGVARHGEIHLSSGPRREVVGVPDSRAIDLALNRLALRGERWIVGFRGRGESEVDDSPGGLGRLAAHLERLGYRIVALDPRQLEALPENTALLLVAGPREPYDAHTLGLIERFLADDGPLLWLAEAPLPDALAEALGVVLLPGIVVDAAAARYRLDSPDNAIVDALPDDLRPPSGEGHAVLKRARALALGEREGWRLHERLQSGPRSWNETGDLRGQIARDPALGEQAGPLTVGVLLQRATGSPGVALVGGRHFVDNDQIGQGANLALASGLVRWLTANEALADAAPPADLEVRWSPRLAAALALGLMAVLPAAYLAAGLWRRARRRRA